ncbi:MAG TPA: hypothetical protein PK984_04500 [Paludibacteraceae bacterium]|nr:hypothetical protein [Paludibacteraceae bacterium]HOS37457.1 hypothetical protein [Paludibacteraceae bacterium]HPK20337.1 hypothetical protein [Paludibacteraceae bacterium]
MKEFILEIIGLFISLFVVLSLMITTFLIIKYQKETIREQEKIIEELMNENFNLKNLLK